MRAVVCHAFGPFENLLLEEAPAPELRPGTVRIRHEAIGVSFATHLVVAGRYQRRPPLPFSPGTEVAGVVAEVGGGTTRVRPGDRVLATLDWGGQAEQSVAPEVCVHPIPDAMGFAEATNFALSYPTSYAALVWKARLQAGEVVLVHGAAGAVGIAAVEIAKALGACVIATAGNAEKVDLAIAHGADHGVVYGEDGVAAAVKALTEGRGADVIIDPIGGPVTRDSLRAINREGRLLALGFASGAIPEIPANLLLLKNISALGLNYGTYVGWGPEDDREEFAPEVSALQQQLFTWFEEGRLHPVVSHRFPLERFQEAMATVLSRASRGKVVLEPGGGENC